MAWQPAWIQGGNIKEVVWVDRDVIAWYSGVHIIFFNLINKQEIFFSCSPYADGVCCIAGHPTIHLIAFSERSRSPKILVYSYPSMIQISQCCEGSESGYLGTAFASSNYLISLGSCPQFSLIIWNWKNGDKLYSVPTSIHDLDAQIIRVSVSQPLMIAQLGQDSGKLSVWTVVTTSTIVMCHEKISLPREATAVYVDWSEHRSDPQLAIVDQHGHVYISEKDGRKITRVVFSQRCGICFDYEKPIVVWFDDGIILKTTFCQIRYYVRSTGGYWKRNKYIKSELKPYIITVNPFQKKELFYFTGEGFLMQMNSSDTSEDILEVDKKFYLGGIYTFVDFIYPWARDLVIIDKNFNFSVVNSLNGKCIGRLDMTIKGKIINLLSHLDYPLVAFTTTNGELFIISVQQRDNPSVLMKFHLQDIQLDILKFSQCGKHLITGAKNSGNCFCIVSTAENLYSKIFELDIKFPIVDVVIYDENGVLTLLVLMLASTMVYVGDYITVYELLPHQKEFTQAKIVMHLPKLYQQLHYAPRNSKILVASPYLSRQINFFNRTSKSNMNLFNAVAGNHQVRGLEIQTNREFITTWAIDGVVTILTGQTHDETPTILLTHHRGDLGVLKAICNPSGSLVIALGQNGSIVCLKLKGDDKLFIDDEIEQKKIIQLNRNNVNGHFLKLLHKGQQIIPPSTTKASTWVKWREEEEIMKEEEENREEKKSIIDNLNELKGKLRQMLDENEKCPDIEKLPISAFDLAVISREQKIKSAREEREDLHQQLEFECTARNKVFDWIKKEFWDVLDVLPKSIFPIFGDDEVTNYPTDPDDLQDEEMHRWAEYFSNSNTKVDCFNPQLERSLLIKRRYGPSKTDERSITESIMMDDQEYENEQERREKQRACIGTTTHKFIQPFSQYSQFEDYNYQQFMLMTRNINKDIQQLKNYFNKLFTETCEMKKQEVELLIERNKKIHEIDSELKLLFNESVPETPRDPEWNQKENPESIITVLDSEMTAEPYVSPSQENLAKNLAEEEEKKKLLSTADDFREKALITMMNGVLEIRWEDVVKKDIPKPQCMLTKSPDNYNDEDILAVKTYEKNLEILMREREKYKRILESEYLKVKNASKEGIEKFNSSLQELSLLKMRVDSAIKQLNLLKLRKYLAAYNRYLRRQRITDCEKKILDNTHLIEEYLEQNRIIELLLPDLMNHRGILLAKEKAMEEEFEMLFRSFRKIIVRVLTKQYKRRPRKTIKYATAAEFLELGRCIVTCSQSKFLNHYCIEYLTGVNTIDVQPSNLPESITPGHWSRLVKVRRNKIQIEMELRANLIEINEVDIGVKKNNEKIESTRENIIELENEIKEIDHQQLDSDINFEIQLVFPMGQVEIIRNGRRNEMKDALLLPVQKITTVNDKILQVAKEKLTAMERTLKLKRGSAFKEWQHECLKMELANLLDDLHEVQTFPVLKNIQEILKNYTVNSGVEKLNKILHQTDEKTDAFTITQDKSLTRLKKKLKDIEKKAEKIKQENDELDQKIIAMNVDNWELRLQRNLKTEENQKKSIEQTKPIAIRRAQLVAQIHRDYIELLKLKKEHEQLLSRKFSKVSIENLCGECNSGKE